MADGITYAASSLALGQTVSVYAFLLPSLQEVRRASPDDAEMRRDVRIGQAAAAGLTIGIGISLASMADSALPVYVSVFIAAIIAATYEIAMKG